ncbi:MAG: hypothetical protein PHP08_03040 [Candidatus Dojkabacteria bacterium]|jgi:hypothetical protein|nr:hypothetical protein [Candidatus Dojkabacteria bacterium]
MNYQLAQFIVNVFIAIGTVGSVAISLWFAIFSRRERTKITISLVIDMDTRERYVNISIVNTGSIDYRLSYIYFHINNVTIMPTPVQFYQPLPDDRTPIPPGSRVNCLLLIFSFDAYIDNTQVATPEQVVKLLKKGYVIVFTARGTKFIAKFSKRFIRDYSAYRLSKQSIYSKVEQYDGIDETH